MTYQATPSHLEEFFVEIEGFDKKVYNSTTNAPPRLLEGFIEEIEGFDEVRLESVKDSIIHRVNAMLRYVFAVCQSKPEKKPKADKAVEQLCIYRKIS